MNVREVIERTGCHWTYGKSLNVREVIERTGSHWTYGKSLNVRDVIERTGCHWTYRKSLNVREVNERTGSHCHRCKFLSACLTFVLGNVYVCACPLSLNTMTTLFRFLLELTFSRSRNIPSMNILFCHLCLAFVWFVIVRVLSWRIGLRSIVFSGGLLT